MNKYDACKMQLDAMEESWDDLMVTLAHLSDCIDGGDWKDADRETLIEEFDPWDTVNKAIERIEELVAAVTPLSRAYKSSSKIIRPGARIDDYYIWKPTSTNEETDGISVLDLKKANDVLKKMWRIDE